jgi:hypothetical protein
MPQPSRPTPWGRKLIGLLREVVADKDGSGLPAISHRLPIATPDSAVPGMFTLDLSPDQQGAFLVVCREVPDLVLLAKTEEEALARAEQAIREAMHSPRASPDFPY